MVARANRAEDVKNARGAVATQHPDKVEIASPNLAERIGRKV